MRGVPLLWALPLLLLGPHLRQGLRAVRTGTDRHDPLGSAADCGGCHEEAFQAWRASRHAKAWDNRIFQAGFIREPVMRCVHCHAPTRAQAREVASALPAGDFFQVRRTLMARGITGLPRRALAHEGVGCQACHVREGQVWTKTLAGVDDHVVRPEAKSLAAPETCAQCHQFQFHRMRRGRIVLTGRNIQSTYDEWRAWGGKATCLDCHAQGNPHAIRGSHDLAFLKGALDVRREGQMLVLASHGVGHHFPTGDLFRHLTVEAHTADGWQRIGFIGRVYDATKLVSDSSLLPGVPRRIPLPPSADRVRVRYHYISEASEARGDVAPTDAWVQLLDDALGKHEAERATRRSGENARR